MDKLLNNIFNVYRDSECAGFGHSYLLRRKAGNVLMPRLGIDAKVSNEYEAIERLGGIDRIFITDYHFGGHSCEEIALRFSSTIVSSIVEKPKLKKKGLNRLTAFPYERQWLEDDLEIIPVPGHTSGGVCLRWTDADTTYLFTGDFLYFDGCSWIAGAKTRRKIEKSLTLIKDLEFDYLVGCGSDGVDVPYVALASREEKVDFIDSVLAAFKK